MSEIVIQDYSSQWPLAFQELKLWYLSALGSLITDVQHVGSTSVAGLAAKPVIDMDIIIEDSQLLPQVIVILSQLGYQHRGNLGIAGREAFKLEEDPNRWPKHNLYVCPANNIHLKNHLLFRDFLRNNPDTANRYGALKKELAVKYTGNIELYVEAKTAFIIDILRKSGLDEATLSSITDANIGNRYGFSVFE